MEEAKIIDSHLVRLVRREAEVVSMADPGESTWGYHQCPTISRMPGGEILLVYKMNQDDNLCYGHASPAFLSQDEGRTWQIVDLEEKAVTCCHSPVFEVFDGEFMCVPMPLGFSPGDLSEETL